MATRGTSDINLSCHCIDRKSTRLNSSHSLHDALPIAVKLSGLLPVEEIHEAVKVLGHEDGYARNLRHQLELPLHPQFRGRGLEFRAECAQVESFQRPFDAHKKQAGLVVLMLIGVGDVGAVSIEKACHGCDQAFTVRTVDQENSGIGHCSESA